MSNFTENANENTNIYYEGIRASNIASLHQLIGTLMCSGSGTEVLDSTLSRPYEELCIKNVPITEETEIFIKQHLLNLRFFSHSPEHCESEYYNVESIRQRVAFLVSIIKWLKDYLIRERVDDNCVFALKCIAESIHILKQQLKSTYDILPWEELEFCLISYISAITKRSEINIFCNYALSEDKIIKYLDTFANKLRLEIDAIVYAVNRNNLSDLPIISRNEAFATITGDCPQFRQLYKDHRYIRDNHSLMKIRDYAKSALTADNAGRVGQLAVLRALQVIGEYLKNDLENPKLDTTQSELILLLFSKDIRKFILDLRNSYSDVHSFCKRIEIEENADDNFFTAVRYNLAAIIDVITYLLYRRKIRILRELIRDTINSYNIEETKEIFEGFIGYEFEDMDIMESSKTREFEKIDKLLRGLSDNITEKTKSEKDKFEKLTHIINASKTTSENGEVDYGRAIKAFWNIWGLLNCNNMDEDSLFESTRDIASRVMQDTDSSMRPEYFTNIVELINEIFHSTLPRMRTKNLDEVKRLSIEILCIVDIETDNRKLLKQLSKNRFFESTYEPYKGFDLTNKDYDDLLTLKSSELYNLLSRNGLIGNKTIPNFPFCKDDKALQAAIEILVLDIMSILDTHKNQLTNNILFLDDDAPLLTGKCLHKYLAHGDSLIDLFLPNPSIEIILNAERLMSTNVTKCHTKIGKLILNSPSKLLGKYYQFFQIIGNQVQLFVALERGSPEHVMSCINHGADIKARTLRRMTALHLAAKGPCIDSLKLVLKQFENANMKDVYGRSPLHVAVAEKRTNIVDYLVRNKYVYIEDQDNMNRTPLHIAALINHIDIVKILLTYNANSAIRDRNGYSPLHYAIKYNHIDVAKIILEKEVNVDVNDTLHHDTPLHIAAENGHLELVNYLLKKNANVNARNAEAKSPLHLAVTNGHEDVVNVLLLTGAEVNAKCNKGYTPLHDAVLCCHDDLIDILLKYGADVNAADNENTNKTPLHIAVSIQDKECMKTLLDWNADTNIASAQGCTPLHVAAKIGHLNIVDTLLKHGSDISSTNAGTPLFSAVQSGKIEVTKLLINNGADVNAKNLDGPTPLHVAIMDGFNDIAEHLIKNNADIHARDDSGRTPLHIAAMKNSVSIIDLLIKYKAEVNVITKCGLTPLYLSALRGNEEAAALLIKHKADVNIQSAGNNTSLHGACLNGNENIVKLLLRNNAFVNGANDTGFTPLLVAIEAGHKKVIEILIVNGAYVTVNAGDKTPLLYAINLNRKEIVDVLIDNGADIYLKCGEPLFCAVRAGYSDILQVLLSNRTSIDIESLADGALLHLATERGHKDVVNILVNRGYNVNANITNGATPLCIAAKQGHGDIVEILIANGANVDVQSDEDTPLHIAVKYNNANVVKVLLNNKADINIKGDNNKKRTPLELAVETGNLPIVKMILKNRMVDVNGTGDKWSVLHMAANNKNINMLKYLVNYGYDVNIRDEYGLKPIHIAIMAGYIDNVHFLLGKEAYNNEHSIDRQVLLRCAVVSGHIEVVRYLHGKGAEVNGNNIDILTPMHVAAICGCKDVVKVLLNKDAIFNLVDKDHKTPLQMSTCPDVTNVLSLIAKLFKSIQDNNFLEVEKDIRSGAIVNAKNCNNLTPLHCAVWKGNNHIVDILLQNGANPNVLDINGFTPLHYAAQFSHFNVVQNLLLHGAVYDAVSYNGKNPVHLTTNAEILALFNLINDSFKHVSLKNTKFFTDLNETLPINLMKLMIRARSSRYKMLDVFASHHNFPLMDLLRLEPQSEMDLFTKAIKIVENKGDYNEALSVFRHAFERRKKLFGSSNTGTLTVLHYMANIKYLQKEYQEAVDILEHIYQTRKDTLGLNSRHTMLTRVKIAFVLHARGLHKTASNIYREVYQKQSDTLGQYHVDTVKTQFEWAAVFLSLRKYEEATKMYKSVVFARKSYLKENDADNLEAYVQLAISLCLQKKYAEALDLYKKVFEIKNTILGIQNVETLQALWKVAQTLVILNKHDEALRNFQKILDTTKEILQEPHPFICRTQYELASILYCQGKYVSALKYYSISTKKWQSVLESGDESAITDSNRKIELITYRLMSGISEE